MKVAAAEAIAKLAREDVPDEVVAAMGGERPHYGKDYIIPSTFDPRLISCLLYTSPSPRDGLLSRMPSSA